jgi:hypothetical protein
MFHLIFPWLEYMNVCHLIHSLNLKIYFRLPPSKLTSCKSIQRTKRFWSALCIAASNGLTFIVLEKIDLLYRAQWSSFVNIIAI